MSRLYQESLPGVYLDLVPAGLPTPPSSQETSRDQFLSSPKFENKTSNSGYLLPRTLNNFSENIQVSNNVPQPLPVSELKSFTIHRPTPLKYNVDSTFQMQGRASERIQRQTNSLGKRHNPHVNEHDKTFRPRFYSERTNSFIPKNYINRVEDVNSTNNHKKPTEDLCHAQKTITYTNNQKEGDFN